MDILNYNNVVKHINADGKDITKSALMVACRDYGGEDYLEIYKKLEKTIFKKDFDLLDEIDYLKQILIDNDLVDFTPILDDIEERVNDTSN